MLIPVHNSADSAHASVWSKIFIEALEVSALSVRATVKRAPSGSQGLSLNPLLAIVDTISTALISIDDAPVSPKAFKNYHVFSGPSDVAGRISRHYQIELWWSILSVMLSLDCFGKPYETFTDLAYALQRLLIVPVGTLFSSRPWRFPTASCSDFWTRSRFLYTLCLTASPRSCRRGQKDSLSSPSMPRSLSNASRGPSFVRPTTSCKACCKVFAAS